MIDEAAEVLAFWFGKLAPEQRFARNPEIDAQIRDRFGTLHERLSNHVPDLWLEDPESMLAAIIVLDQFSRNLYRDDPRAYASDAMALNLARTAIQRGYDQLLSDEEKQFLYMPFMHSEDLEDQTRSVQLFAGINNEEAFDYALQHRLIVERFGRFPHRNAVLGRETTAEEAEFLTQPGSSF